MQATIARRRTALSADRKRHTESVLSLRFDVIPVSAELPFPDGLDLQGNEAFQRVWDAQFLLRATLRWVCRYWRSPLGSWVRVRWACKSLSRGSVSARW